MKIALVGEKGVGKTAFITRISSGEFIKAPGNPSKLFNFDIEIERKWVHIEVHEMEKLDSEDYDAVIYMFDKTNLKSLCSLNVNPNLHCVILGNNRDFAVPAVTNGQVRKRVKSNSYWSVSSKSNYNIYAPMEKLLGGKMTYYLHFEN